MSSHTEDDRETFSGIGDSFQYDSCDSIDGEFNGQDCATSLLQTDSVIFVGQQFQDKRELQKRLQMVKVNEGFECKVYKSNRSLLVVKCAHDKNCKWMLRASRASPLSDWFTVRKYTTAHTCPLEGRKCERVSAKIMSEILINNRGKDAQHGRPEDLRGMMLRQYGVEVKYWNSWKTVQHVKDAVRGTPEEGYARLPSYIHLIKQYNPGTVAHMETDDDDRFKYLFISFGASIKGFRFIRKVIVVDGSFLKGKYKGLLLVATAQDGNYNIFPIAFGIVDAENDESWEWFFTSLRQVISDSSDLVIVSDRHKSIGRAIMRVFPLSHRAICTYHLQKNIITKFRGGPIMELVKKAARAYTLTEFGFLFAEIGRQHPRLQAYLQESDIQLWSRAHFSGDRYNIMTSNIAESINAALKKARELPVVTFLEYVGKMMSRWFCERRTSAALRDSEITEKVDEILSLRTNRGKHYTVVQINATRYQVSTTNGVHVVDFDALKCTCRVFDVHKIPCDHALAAAKKTVFTWENLVSRHYTTTSLFGAYAESISPIEEWVPPPEIVAQRCLPPKVKKGAGRPKKKRYVTALERASQPIRQKQIHACSTCGLFSHNIQTCPDRES